MEQELGLGAKAKSPLLGNHSARKTSWPRSLPSLSLQGGESVGLREEVSPGIAAEEALRTIIPNGFDWCTRNPADEVWRRVTPGLWWGDSSVVAFRSPAWARAGHSPTPVAGSQAVSCSPCFCSRPAHCFKELCCLQKAPGRTAHWGQKEKCRVF